MQESEEKLLRAAISRAVHKAMNEIGLVEFKKCSFFMSNTNKKD